MSILSSIISVLTTPQTTNAVGGDDADNDFKGSSKNDKLVFDATQNYGEDFKLPNADFSKLDGGAGFDTLVIKLTESQNTALKLEMKAKLGTLFKNGLDLGELISLFKIATGQQFVKFESIGAELKGWECINFQVVPDNKAPKAVADTLTAQEDNVYHGSVATNDSDSDANSVLTYKVSGTLPAGLTFRADGTYDFDAKHADYQYLVKDQQLPIVVSYTVTDQFGACSSSTLTITIIGSNEVPTYIDAYGRGNFMDSTKSIDLNLVTSKLEFEEGTQSWTVTKDGEEAYFAGGDAVPGFSFKPWQYIGSNYSDRMIGNDGIQAISGEGGNDFIYGNGGNDELRGETGDDYLDGGVGNDWLVGGEGNDTIVGGAGNDTIAGLNGDDLIVYNPGNNSYIAGDGSDVIEGGAGVDTLQINRLAGEQNIYWVNGTGAGFDVSVDNFAGVFNTLNVKEVEKLDISLKGNEWVAIQGDLVGVEQVNVHGNDDGQSLFTFRHSGNAAITADLAGGNDSFWGGGHVVGANVDGGTGTDTVNYSVMAGPVTIDLNAGTATRGTVVDKIVNFENATGSQGSDYIYGSALDNVLDGDKGNDLILAGGGNDTLYGGEGFDHLRGEAGDDIIDGGLGSDYLAGGAGADILYAGNDDVTDFFLFTAVNGAGRPVDGSGVDQVHQFVAGQDQFQLDVMMPGFHTFAFADDGTGTNSYNVSFTDTLYNQTVSFHVNNVVGGPLTAADFVII